MPSIIKSEIYSSTSRIKPLLLLAIPSVTLYLVWHLEKTLFVLIFKWKQLTQSTAHIFFLQLYQPNGIKEELFLEFFYFFEKTNSDRNTNKQNPIIFQGMQTYVSSIVFICFCTFVFQTMYHYILGWKKGKYSILMKFKCMIHLEVFQTPWTEIYIKQLGILTVLCHIYFSSTQEGKIFSS